MHRALGAVDDEVVDQRAVAGDRLGADAGRPGTHVGRRSSGTKRRSSPTKALRLAAGPSSPTAVRQWSRSSRQVPGQLSVSARSRGLTRSRR